MHRRLLEARGELAHPPRQGLADPEGEPRQILHQRDQVGPLEAEQAHAARRGDGGGPRSALEERDLAEEAPGPELGQEPAPAGHADHAFDQQVEAVVEDALARDRLPWLVRLLPDHPREVDELPGGERLEERQRAQLERDLDRLHDRMIPEPRAAGQRDAGGERPRQVLGVGEQRLDRLLQLRDAAPERLRREAPARAEVPLFEQRDEPAFLAPDQRLERLEHDRVPATPAGEAQLVAELRDAVVLVERGEQAERRVELLVDALEQALADDREAIAVAEGRDVEQVASHRSDLALVERGDRLATDVELAHELDQRLARAARPVAELAQQEVGAARPERAQAVARRQRPFFAGRAEVRDEPARLVDAPRPCSAGGRSARPGPRRPAAPASAPPRRPRHRRAAPRPPRSPPPRRRAPPDRRAAPRAARGGRPSAAPGRPRGATSGTPRARCAARRRRARRARGRARRRGPRHGAPSRGARAPRAPPGAPRAMRRQARPRARPGPGTAARAATRPARGRRAPDRRARPAARAAPRARATPRRSAAARGRRPRARGRGPRRGAPGSPPGRAAARPRRPRRRPAARRRRRARPPRGGARGRRRRAPRRARAPSRGRAAPRAPARRACAPPPSAAGAADSGARARARPRARRARSEAPPRSPAWRSRARAPRSPPRSRARLPRA